jgi:hypothetical protein
LPTAGADATFSLHAAQFVVFGLVALMAFRHLAGLTHERRVTLAIDAAA